MRGRQLDRCPPCPARLVWIGLAGVFLAIEAVLVGADLGLWGTRVWRSQAYQLGGFWAGLLHGWEPIYAAQPGIMFASYTFLHSGWQHLLGNLAALTWLGLYLEKSCGGARFSVLFAISALGGALCFGLLTQSPRPMVGASGAITGLIAVWIAHDAREMSEEGAARREILGVGAIRIVVLSALNLLAARLESSGLAWEAHLGGFLAAALAMAVVPALRP